MNQPLQSPFKIQLYAQIKDRGTAHGAFPEMGKVPSGAEADEVAALHP